GIKFIPDDLFVLNLFQIAKSLHPRFMFPGVTKADEFGERFFCVGMYRDVRRNDLVNFGFVDLDMDHLCLLRILGNIAGYPVVETHSDTDKNIALIGIDVGSIISMHSEKANIIRMVCRETTQPQQRTSYR